MSVAANGVYGTLPVPTHRLPMYAFAGWYTSPTGGTEITSETQLATNSDHTLYAHWRIRYVTVTLDPVGGDGGYVDALKVNGKMMSLPPSVKHGYAFNGWYTEKSGGEKITYIDPGENFA